MEIWNRTTNESKLVHLFLSKTDVTNTWGTWIVSASKFASNKTKQDCALQWWFHTTGKGWHHPIFIVFYTDDIRYTLEQNKHRTKNYLVLGSSIWTKTKLLLLLLSLSFLLLSLKVVRESLHMDVIMTLQLVSFFFE